MVDPDEEQSRFVEQCRRHFAQNPGAMKLIDEFEEFYMPNGALYYYSCDGFFYRLVNRALRRQTIEGIRDFRFLLLDIREQLQLAHKKFLDKETKVGMSKTFFRGQRMSDAELKELHKKHHDGTLITTNSYFSTSESIEVARMFAGKPENGIVSVLFEITAEIKDSQIKQRKPFAKIGNYSKFGDEEREVLFSIGSFFKIDTIYEESPSFWIVKITLVDEDDKNQAVTGDFRTLRTCSPEIKVIKIGDLLAKHPRQEISKAKEFYDFIKNSDISKALGAACIAGLGWLALKEKNAALAIEQQQIALGLYEQLKLEGESESLTHLYITSYNCIGASFRLIKRYRRALEYYTKAEKLLLKVPIDKYAMYEEYRNITSINIAVTHKLQGEVDQAWDHYKKILAYEMNTSTRFHGHTYLTIAQAGLHDSDEYDRHSQSWKAFLDLSLTNMSSSYRRSIISGVLLIGFQCANNEQTRTMAIDYFQKVIRISRRYANINRDDYHIVLACLNQVARLETKRRQYGHSISYALEALNMCHEDDLTDIAECYESIALNYEQQILDRTNDLTPDDIRRMIIENPFANTTEPTVPLIVLAFKRSEFAFGQYSIKTMNPKFSEETDRHRCLAYCHLKLAALAQARGYKENDDRLVNKACQLLEKVAQTLKDDPQAQQICINNMNYLNEDFDSIINSYQEELNRNQQKNKACIGEDAFAYIAHLYARKKDADEEHRWYNLAVQYFESHGHICEHTVMCFRKLARFYEKHENMVVAMDIYERLINYLVEYLPCSFLRTSIKPIGMKIVEHFKEKGDSKQAILILQDLIDLMLLDSDDDEHQVDEQFKKLITKCIETAAIVVNRAYEQYFEVLLRHKPQPFDSYMRAIEHAFRQAISVYQTGGNYRKSIEAYQQYIELLI
ncbi:unnamed protein product, partial [Rotaria sordida]